MAFAKPLILPEVAKVFGVPGKEGAGKRGGREKRGPGKEARRLAARPAEADFPQ
jgi:hypothetical protein